MIYMFFIGYIIGGIVGAFILACILLANKMCVVIKEKNKDEEIKALTKANENLKVLYQDIVTQSEWHDEDYKKEIERLNNIINKTSKKLEMTLNCIKDCMVENEEYIKMHTDYIYALEEQISILNGVDKE